MSAYSPARAIFRCTGLDVREVVARARFAVCEGQQTRTFGNPWKELRLESVTTPRYNSTGAQHDGRQIGLDHEALPEDLHEHGHVDERATEPAVRLR